MTESILRVRGLTKTYPREREDASLYARLWNKAWGWTGRLDTWRKLNEGIPVLRGVDLEVFENETVAILGQSGAGKSTLLHLMGGLDRPDQGVISYRGRDLTTLRTREVAEWRNRRVGFVFQFYHLFPDLTAEENVLIPAMVAYGPLEYRRRKLELRERAKWLLDQVRLGDRGRHRPSQLSGGEQQRVAIARALVLEPELLLCDEPTGNLDRRTGEEVLELLLRLKSDHNQTYVIVTHDHSLADRVDRVVTMADGLVEGTTERKAPEAPAEVPAEVPAEAPAKMPAKLTGEGEEPTSEGEPA